MAKRTKKNAFEESAIENEEDLETTEEEQSEPVEPHHPSILERLTGHHSDAKATAEEPHHASLLERLTGHHSEADAKTNNPPANIPGKYRKFQ